ncbi:MAG TPA: T9SS type A sorting domain-containing protein [Bacteroidia bacterium]|nr:T9SS type A sorting domain-containing protein [Bacteroidia bacterium]HNU32338.1 T9SS type A sorting domain-containing protein [Bacteroidia bacterium]
MKNKKSIFRGSIGIVCIAVLFVMFTSHAQVVVTANVTPVTCFGHADGTISISATGGTTPYQYSIDGGITYQTSNVFANLAAGIYQVWVIDAILQTGNTNANVIEPTQLVLTLNTTNPSCNGGANGVICAIATGGVTPYTYLWNDGSVLPCLNGGVSGTYTVTVTDNNGCSVTNSAILTQPSPLSIVPIPDVSICQGEFISVCPTAFGGTPLYSYQLQINGNPIPGFMPCDSFAVSTNSIFVITVTDANGCSATDDFNVTVNPLPVLGIQANVIACNLPVQICIPQVSGNSPFAFAWNTGEFTQCINAPTTGIYSYAVTDANGCTVGSNISVSYSPGWQGIDFTIDSLPDCGQCNGGLTVNLVGGAGGPVTYQWSSGITTQFNTGVCDNQNGYVIATDTNNCVDTAFYKLDCFSVWPGDANNDGVANNVDILPIGIGYGTLGIARPNATINWQAENNLNWTDTLAGGTNYKHIDCNGDGIIADDDTIAILQNFGLTHPLRVTQRLQNITDPPLYFDIIVDTVGTSQQLDIPLYFGTSTIPADSIYGMAFTVNYDTSLVKADSVQIGFSPSWLGTTGSDLIYISKNDTQNGKLYVGVTRINQNDTSGFGEIARVTVVTTDNVSGRLSQPIYDTLHFSISDLTIINVDEIERNAYVTGDSLIIEDLTALDELDQLKKNIFVFPNPAKENVNVKSSFAKVVSVQLTDVAGKQLNDSGSDNNPLIKRLNDFEFCININSLQKGMYLINIKTNSGTITKRFTVAD